MRTKLMALLMVVAFAGSAAAEAIKLSVMDTAGTANKFVVTDQGRIGIGDVSTLPSGMPTGGFHAKSGNVGLAQFVSHTNGVTAANLGGGFVCLHNNAAGALPNKNDRLGYYYFGSQSTARLIPVGFTAYADENWTDTSQASSLVFTVGKTGSAARIESLRLSGNTNVGVGGVTTPTQKLEVNGGVRLNTATAQPACDANSRGTIWFFKDPANANDTMEVCAIKGGNYGWQPLF